MNEPADTRDPQADRYPADTSMIEVLAQFVARGFDGHFDVDEHTGGCRCEQCGTSSAPADIEVVDSRRLEGASDPADMSSVMAMQCPACSQQGTAVVRYGPEASAGESALLQSSRGATRADASD
jgi:hypothetical protein